MITIEYRNKYSDHRRHLFICAPEGEVRLCDNLASEACKLPGVRHTEGKECRKCQAVLQNLVDNDKVIKRGNRMIVII